MADTDVVLLDGQVKVEASDLCLDWKERRKNQSEYRRALVHDYNDTLTLNWGGDYPNGVKIEGKIEATGSLTVKDSLMVNKIRGDQKDWQVKVEACDLCVDWKDRRKNQSEYRRAVTHGEHDELILNYAGDYPNGVRIDGKINATDSLAVKNSVEAKGISCTSLEIVKSFLPTPLSTPVTYLNITHDKIEVITKSPGVPQPITNTLDLVAEIKVLRSEVEALKAKLNK